MIDIPNYEAVREAIARWYGLPTHRTVEIGGELRRSKLNPICFPDPLNNPADAWSLQCALVAWCDTRGYMLDWPSVNACEIFEFTRDDERFIARGEGATPAEALVRAWLAAFGGEA